MSCTINPDLLTKTWKARWISFDGDTSVHYGVYLFRKILLLQEAPANFVVHVSADSRYQLYVNGAAVCNGPARSYSQKWNFETADIAPFLHSGENCIAAIVWNFGQYNPIAQISVTTGFIMQGDGENEATVNTDESWSVFHDEAYEPKPVMLKDYYAAGAGEKFTSEKHPWNWLNTGYDASNWSHAVIGEVARPFAFIGEYGPVPPHVMAPRPVPLMEEKMQRFFEVRRSSPFDATERWLNGVEPFVIPAHTKETILLDQRELTTAYPVLVFSNGRACSITITYAESLFAEDGSKGNRNEIEGKRLYGASDELVCDGGSHRTYRPLFWRAFRYVELQILTGDDAVCIEDFYSQFCAYPLKELASFSCNDDSLAAIWKTGWRTQRLCLNETFFDCPYYEQLQYIGDTRIQSLVVQAVSGDRTPVKNAISQLRASLQPEGITLSRFPTRESQIISPFSLVWVVMVYDYFMLNDDEAFVERQIPAMQEILNWFLRHRDKTGMLRATEWWSFIDWVDAPGWSCGNPPESSSGHSAIVNLFYVYAVEKAAVVFAHFGYGDVAKKYQCDAEKIKEAVVNSCFAADRALLADSPAKNTFSQHVNILGILTNAFPHEITPARVLDKILTDKTLAPCTLYFDYYLFEAMEAAGEQDRFLEALGPWRTMLQQGLTTFAETPDPTRSDCHGWSASPLYFFLTLIAGIQPAGPTFASVKIAPHFCTLMQIDASYPHKNGMIKVHLQKKTDGQVEGEINLPERVTGIFTYQNKDQNLQSGVTKISLYP